CSEGDAHEWLICRRAVGSGKQRRRRQYGGGCQRNNDASAAMQVHCRIRIALIVKAIHLGLLNTVQVSLNKFASSGRAHSLHFPLQRKVSVIVLPSEGAAQRVYVPS